ncbi:MAG: hypothetical protein R3F11_21960 [Verrucomicrobiales bacterium]
MNRALTSLRPSLPLLARGLRAAFAIACAASVAALPWLPPRALAQDDPAPEAAEANAAADQASPLGVRQERVRRMLGDLEKALTELSRKLEAEEPDQAARLRTAFQKAKEYLLGSRMEEIAALLNASALESATAEQKEISGDIESLIELLLRDETEAEKRQRELEQLQKWNEAIKELIDREMDLMEDTQIAADPEAAAMVLEAMAKKADDLIKKQEALKQAAEQAKGNPEAAEALADEQAELRAETEEFAEELQQAADQAPMMGKAASAAQSATEEQKDAERALGAAQPQEAQKPQQKAIDDLKEASESLKNEAEKAREKQAAEEQEKLAGEQGEAQQQAGDVAKEMAESSAAEQTPGAQQAMEGAQQSMQSAQQSLQQGQPQAAPPKQQESIEQMQQAQEEIEQRIQELQEEQRQDMLAKYLEIFRGMLERQQQMTAETKETDAKRDAEGNLPRRDRVGLRNLAKGESSLKDETAKAEADLMSDPAGIVFGEVVSAPWSPNSPG